LMHLKIQDNDMADEPKVLKLVQVKKGLFASPDYTPPTDLDTQDLKEIARDLLRRGQILLTPKVVKD
jgi:hypothetical protein